MDSLQGLKSRLKAVKNISQITKAMEVVSATKMRKSQEIALKSRPFAIEALKLLGQISGSPAVESSLMKAREIKNTLIVLMTSDRGLAGSFNTQISRKVDKFLSQDEFNKVENHKYILLPIGKKAISYASKSGLEIIEKFTGFGDFIEVEEIESLSKIIIDGYEKAKWDRVFTVSMQFRSTIKQDPLIRQIFPIDLEKIKETVDEIIPEHGRYSETNKENGAPDQSQKEISYIFEPSPKEIVESLIPHLVKMQIYHLVLEANASEHSARMVAMKTAGDNANEMIGKLTLSYNKVRQASITKELIEITGTQSALN